MAKATKAQIRKADKDAAKARRAAQAAVKKAERAEARRHKLRGEVWWGFRED